MHLTHVASKMGLRKTLEPPPMLFPTLGSKERNGKIRKTKQKIPWKSILVVGFVTIAVGVGGGIGGFLPHQRRFVSAIYGGYK